MRRLSVFALIACAQVGGAQSGVRGSAQFVSYTIGDPSKNAITEMAVPLFGYMPISRLITLDIGTAYASAKVTNTSGAQSTVSTISGLTDTQIRATVNLGSDLVLLTAGLNVPTGRSTATQAEQAAASLIGNDFLVFPISSMGSGFGGTGGLALAHPFGDWNLGAGGSIRHSMPFDPYEDGSGGKLHYTPGDELRARVGVDHPFGTGRASVGVTYSTFTDDNIEGSIYNTGNRIITQAYASNAYGVGEYTISAWNLYRAAGTQVDGSASGTESITDATAAYALALGRGRIEPSLSVRTWVQQDLPTSLQTTMSVRYDMTMGPVTVSPGAGFTVGRLAASGTSAATTASLSGYHLQLTVRSH